MTGQEYDKAVDQQRKLLVAQAYVLMAMQALAGQEDLDMAAMELSVTIGSQIEELIDSNPYFDALLRGDTLHSANGQASQLIMDALGSPFWQEANL